MNEIGYMRVCAVAPPLKPAAVKTNADAIIENFIQASEQGADIILFPELALSGYTCADLFQQSALLEEVETQAGRIIRETSARSSLMIFGLPLAREGQLYNTALVVGYGKKILGAVPKTYIPEGREFYEHRWFATAEQTNQNTIRFLNQEVPFGTNLLFHHEKWPESAFSAEICEDLWAPIPPSSRHSLAGARLVFNLSASNETTGKADYRRSLIAQQSARTLSAYIYVSSGPGESSTDTVYGGHTIIAENGIILAESPPFSTRPLLSDIDLKLLEHERRLSPTFQSCARLELSRTDTNYRRISFTGQFQQPARLMRKIQPHPFVPGNKAERSHRCAETFAIQTNALATRLNNSSIHNVVLGLSGGLDSTLALLVVNETYKKSGLSTTGIHILNMPGFGSTPRTRENASSLCKFLGIQIETIDIQQACKQEMEQLNHPPQLHDTTFENIQARRRTSLLMNKANIKNAIVIGTGDLSELALGWCTYNGDHMSMYAVNCGIPKTLVRYLVEWFRDNQTSSQIREILTDILATPISPELLPTDKKGCIVQETEKTLGPYELHDFFLFHTLRHGSEPRKIILLAENAFPDYKKEELVRTLRLFYTRFFSSQFKRSCVPDGPKVGSVAFSPRADWRMPSDADVTLWLSALDSL